MDPTRGRCDARVMISGAADDRVLASTRAVAWFIMPFLSVAFAVLWPVPTDTATLFAWHITPTLTPMFLGAAYLGGAYFFVRAGRATQWHTIKGGFVPVATFPDWLVYLRNSRHMAPGADDALRLSAIAARLIGAAGALAAATGLFLFLAPATAIRHWPWHLTPLTARVLGAVFCLGLAGIGAFVDRRWTSARIPVQVALVMLVLIVIAGVRARTELATGNALTWVFVAGFGGLTVAVAALYATMERRSRPTA